MSHKLLRFLAFVIGVGTRIGFYAAIWHAVGMSWEWFVPIVIGIVLAVILSLSADEIKRLKDA